jgi:hypothetical protein
MCASNAFERVARLYFYSAFKSFPFRHRRLLRESNIIASKIEAFKLGLRGQHGHIIQNGSNSFGHIAQMYTDFSELLVFLDIVHRPAF